MLTSSVYLQWKNVKKSKQLMKLANIDKENLYIFQTTWGSSMKFSGKMCLVIILKVTKKQGFTPSLENTVLKKPQGGGQNYPTPSLVRFKSSWFQGEKKLIYLISLNIRSLIWRWSLTYCKVQHYLLFILIYYLYVYVTWDIALINHYS